MTPRVRIDGQRPTTESFAIHTRKIHVRRFIVHLHRRARVSRVLHPRLAIPSRRLDADAASRANPRLAPAASSATSRALPARAPLASSSHRRAFVSLSLRRRAPSFVESSFVASRRFRDTKRRSVPSFASFAPSRTPRRPRRARAPRRASFVVASLSRRVASFRRSPSSRCVVHRPSSLTHHSTRSRVVDIDRPTDRPIDAMRCDG